MTIPFYITLPGTILAIVRTVLGADEDAELRSRFNGLMKRYSPVIDRICFGYAHTAADLQDLKQDAMLNIWLSLPGFNGDCAVQTWIYRVTLNSCVSTLRRTYRTPATVRLTDLYDAIDCDSERKEILADIHDAVALLSPLDKAIVMLWLEGEAYEEIADITGLTKSNVAVRIHRAKNRLKQHFNNE